VSTTRSSRCHRGSCFAAGLVDAQAAGGPIDGGSMRAG
jgi:hypothetical protein